jgi:hypothetical protein
VSLGKDSTLLTLGDFMKVLNLIAIFSTVISLSALSKEGAGSSGGGNPQEVKFIGQARSLHIKLMKIKDASVVLGIDLEDFKLAIDSTEVHCAFPPFKEIMKTKDKLAYFDSKTHSIYLDCPNFDLLKNSGDGYSAVVFHEYMREVAGENSAYQVSSKILPLLETSARQQKKDDCADVSGLLKDRRDLDFFSIESAIEEVKFLSTNYLYNPELLKKQYFERIYHDMDVSLFYKNVENLKTYIRCIEQP